MAQTKLSVDNLQCNPILALWIEIRIDEIALHVSGIDVVPNNYADVNGNGRYHGRHQQIQKQMARSKTERMHLLC